MSLRSYLSIMENLIVIKYGGSVFKPTKGLTLEGCYRAVAAQLDAIAEEYTRVVAVVSAAHGHSDRLINEVAEHEGIDRTVLQSALLGTEKTGEHERTFLDRPDIARVLLQGELDSVDALVAASQGRFHRLTQLDEEFPIEANSSYLRAAVHFDQSKRLASQYALPGGVTVVSGYAARDPHGDVALLGRNASDYVAALLAGLYHGRLCFSKDVDGIYADFGTSRQRLLENPTRADLDALGEQRVLDRRAYHTFRGPIEVMRFSDGQVGTVVRPELVQGKYLLAV